MSKQIFDNGKNNQDKLQGVSFDDIILEQNNPNPFAETSEINYYVPARFKGNARLILSDESGTQILKQYNVCSGKPCQLVISAMDLKTGVYLYGIELNSAVVKSKKLMVIK